MQHGGVAVIQRGQTAIDRGGEIIRLSDAFAVRAEGAGHRGKIPLLALTARHQPRLELVGLGGKAFGINPLHR